MWKDLSVKAGLRKTNRVRGDWGSESCWVKMSIQYEVEPLADSYGVADSFPKDFGYGEEEADIEDSPTPSDSKPRILLMGLRRSGKSSIQKVGSDVGGHDSSVFT